MVVLQMEQLRSSSTVKEVKKLIKAMPGRLQDMYERTFDRIRSQSENDYQLSIRILGWVHFAKRPLHANELQHALAVECPDGPDLPRELDLDNLMPIEDIISTCTGLIAMDRKTGAVHLVHSTIGAYIQDHIDGSFSSVRNEIGRACLAYISFDAFAGGCCAESSELDSRLQDFPFLKYAAKYWGHHILGQMEIECQSSILSFLEKPSNLGCSIQIMHLPDDEVPSRNLDAFPRGVSPLHIASSFGLATTAQVLIKRGGDIQKEDSNGWTALHRAADNGHDVVVDILLKNGADENKRAERGGTPLHRAATRGHDAVARALIEAQADINMEDSYGGTAMHRASTRGHHSVVESLLAAGADVDRPYDIEVAKKLLIGLGSKTYIDPELVTFNYGSDRSNTRKDTTNVLPDAEKWYGGTALHEASENGFESVVLLLLKRGANVDARDNYGGTALHRAAKMGNSKLVRLLLDEGADPSVQYDFTTAYKSPANSGLKPLVEVERFEADATEYETLGQIQEGAYKKALTNDGGTPIHEAAKLGHEAVVKILSCVPGIDLDLEDSNRETALHRAVINRHGMVAQVLLESGAEIDAVERLGRTPLHLAVINRDEEMIHLLLERKAAINTMSSIDHSPLCCAISSVQEQIVRLLLQHGADCNLKHQYAEDPLSHAPLHQAVEIGSKAILELMLKSADVDLNIRDGKGKTPLFLAVEEQRRDGVQILLDRGAHPNLPDRGGISPLLLAFGRERTNAASSEDSMAIISLLLEHGAEPPHKITPGGRESIQVAPEIDQRLMVLLQNQTTKTRAHDANEDESLLLAAAEDGRDSAISLLLQKGVSVEARNRDQETPLILAVKRERQETVELLLKHGASAHSRDSEGQTPLHMAVRAESTLPNILLQNGADIEAKDNAGRTPLYYGIGDGAGASALLNFCLKGVPMFMQEITKGRLHCISQHKPEAALYSSYCKMVPTLMLTTSSAEHP